MTTQAIRQQLHQYIDIAEDEKIHALYVLLQNYISPVYSCFSEELTMLHERAEKYLKDDAKTYSVEESHEMIRRQKNKQ